MTRMEVLWCVMLSCVRYATHISLAISEAELTSIKTMEGVFFSEQFPIINARTAIRTTPRTMLFETV